MKFGPVEFLLATVAYYSSLGVPIRRLLTDNGSCYRSRTFRRTGRRLGIRHRFTPPYTPAPTARPSASSKPPSENGPMPAPTSPPRSAPPISAPGSTTIIGIAPRQPWL